MKTVPTGNRVTLSTVPLLKSTTPPKTTSFVKEKVKKIAHKMLDEAEDYLHLLLLLLFGFYLQMLQIKKIKEKSRCHWGC